MKKHISLFNKIFCDSSQALEWAYKEGINDKAIIYTSSPALLFKNKPNIQHIESHWSVDKMKNFQTTIRKFSEDIFDLALNKGNLSHEESLCIVRESVFFHRLLFKASCLNENDLIKPRLFLKVVGNGGSQGNNMNSPWDLLLEGNPLLQIETCNVKDEIWNSSSNDKVSLLERLKLAGVETIVYRFLAGFMRTVPSFFFNKSVIIPSENELLIEISSYLGLKGVQINTMRSNNKNIINSTKSNESYSGLEIILSSRVRSRLKEWVTPSLVNKCEEIFFQQVYKSLNDLAKLKIEFSSFISREKKNKSILLTNSPVNLKGLALVSICNNNNIPVVSVQHGIAKEISQNHGEVSVLYEINASDCFIAYNQQSANISIQSHFRKGHSFVSGISRRHIRMKHIKTKKKIIIPIVYISTNLYKGNLGMFTTWLTDYERAVNEQKLVEFVLSKIPYKVRYKTYPEDNRRYSDIDPVLESVKSSDNIQLFDKKIDMRYLLAQHRIIITSKATSTIGWPIMTGKPVIFINYPDNNPLSVDALRDFSNALFLFDASNDDFYNELFDFLSKPIEEIEFLWEKKSTLRKKMIKQYFSAYDSNAGMRAANMIIKNYYENTGNYSS